MKYLQFRWKPRVTIILLVSIAVSLLLITLDQTQWAQQINLQGYSHGESDGEGRDIPTAMRYILPFVKEFILIGVPLLLTLLLLKVIAKFDSRN